MGVNPSSRVAGRRNNEDQRLHISLSRPEPLLYMHACIHTYMSLSHTCASFQVIHVGWHIQICDAGDVTSGGASG